MMWLFAILIVLALGAIAMVAAGRGAPMVEEYADLPDVDIAAGPISGRTLRAVRFTTAFRGYRTSEVDELLHRLALQLEAAEDRAAREGASDPEPPVGPDQSR